MTTQIILFISTFFTGAISAITGMGGGIVLLTIMTFFYPITFIVPVHGAVQLASNFSRTLFLRKHVKLSFLIPYIFGAPLGAYYAAMQLRGQLSESSLKILLALLIIYAVFKPKKLPPLKVPYWAFFIVGICAGGLGILVGAVGPFLAPFFLRGDLEKEEIIATKSALQIFTHALKIPAFMLLSFPYAKNMEIILSLIVAVILGTMVGVRLLKRLNEKTFFILFKSILTIAAMRLLYSALFKG